MSRKSKHAPDPDAKTPDWEDPQADPLQAPDFEPPPSNAADALYEETGIDLSEAGGLDSDNVPDDEDAARVKQAPD